MSPRLIILFIPQRFFVPGRVALLTPICSVVAVDFAKTNQKVIELSTG